MPSLETKASPAQPLGTDRPDTLGQSEPAGHETGCAGDAREDGHRTESVLDSHCRTGREEGWVPGVSVLSIQRDAQGLEVIHRIVIIFTRKKNISILNVNSCENLLKIF